MSGAGKTIALKMLEDMGFYCVDNLPIPLADKFIQLAAGGRGIDQAALGIDIRGGEELEALDSILKGCGSGSWTLRCCFWTPAMRR